MSASNTTGIFLDPFFDDHTKRHVDTTPVQRTLFLLWLVVFFLRVVRIFIRKTSIFSNAHVNSEAKAKPSIEIGSSHKICENANNVSDIEANLQSRTDEDNDLRSDLNGDKEKGKVSSTEVHSSSKEAAMVHSQATRTFDDFLNNLIVLGVTLLYFYGCDYIKVFPVQERLYNRDTFLFLVFLLFLSAGVLATKSNQDTVLNRQQTEEWKGWMQVMFVWYHYFHALEWYNWVRVYIAAYVWMTGFGNFSFFWVRADFSLWRVMKMLFRLNFLVILVCGTVKNEYMLYYICAMHTYWFVSVYAMMAVFKSWNRQPLKMALKFVAYALANAFIFEIPGMAEFVFRPVWFILQYHDKSHDILHEWEFRAGLDHWACFIGMLCAYSYPYFEKFIKMLENDSRERKDKLYEGTIKLLIVLICTAVCVLWYGELMHFDKYKYNAIHPYTSWIPVVSYIVVRNVSSRARRYHSRMLEWLGKITLETYISQLHIYLQSNAKHLISYIPGYPLLNFALATIIYLCISKVLFYLTNEISSYILPQDLKYLARNLLAILLALGVAYLFANYILLPTL